MLENFIKYAHLPTGVVRDDNEIYICLHGVLRLRCDWALVSGFMVHQVEVEKALNS